MKQERFYISKNNKKWKIIENDEDWIVQPSLHGFYQFYKTGWKTFEDITNRIEQEVLQDLVKEYRQVKKFYKDTQRRIKRIEEYFSSETYQQLSEKEKQSTNNIYQTMLKTIQELTEYKTTLRNQLVELGLMVDNN